MLIASAPASRLRRAFGELERLLDENADGGRQRDIQTGPLFVHEGAVALDPRYQRLGEPHRELLVVEHLATSPTFAKKFLEALNLGPQAHIVEVAHSVQSSSGESDIEVLVRLEDQEHRILIENKVDAQFQPEQAERYRARAESYARTGHARSAVTALVAPQSYITAHQQQHVFNHYISLETVSSWLSLDLRDSTLSFKRALLDLAVRRAADGWTRVPDQAATRFWRRYWRIAEQRAPQLEMREPQEVPAGSTWIYFRPSLPKNVELIHKFVAGQVDLQFAGRGGAIDEIRAGYASVLDPDMHIVKAGKSAAIRIQVPRCDFTADDGVIEVAIDAASRLAGVPARVRAGAS